MNKLCEPPGPSAWCLPGCPTGHSDAKWCPSDQLCAWRPDQLERMLASQKAGYYNELVIDSRSWIGHMPHTILGVFYARSSSAESKARARKVHSSFRRKYRVPLSHAPLWVYDPAADPPFTLAVDVQ